MTQAEIWRQITRAAASTASGRVEKVRGGWIVRDLDGGYCPTTFRRKREAIAWAAANCRAVLDRLGEQLAEARRVSS